MAPNPVSSSGGVFAFVAAILLIFVGIANFTLHQVVPRHIRFAELRTGGFGSAISSNGARGGPNPNAIYANPNLDTSQRTPGDGLRLFYTWGLWNQCAGLRGRSDPQYCTGTSWAHEFRPTEALLEDIPSSSRARALSLINDQYNTDTYFGVWSRIAFYFIFISACLIFLILLLSLLHARGPGRLGSLNLAVLSLLAFFSAAIGSTIWTAIVGVLRHQLNRDNLGMDANFGNAIWLMWAISGLMLLSSFSYLGGCISGRKRTMA